ncbi:MAG: hypothetical protein GXP36_13160 [Actinobacteria bacterium]|nr:hypothetical protein [Actinomycetota bacterium]
MRRIAASSVTSSGGTVVVGVVVDVEEGFAAGASVDVVDMDVDAGGAVGAGTLADEHAAKTWANARNGTRRGTRRFIALRLPVNMEHARDRTLGCARL